MEQVERAFLYDNPKDSPVELKSVQLAFTMAESGMLEYKGHYLVFGEIRHKFKHPT